LTQRLEPFVPLDRCSEREESASKFPIVGDHERTARRRRRQPDDRVVSAGGVGVVDGHAAYASDRPGAGGRIGVEDGVDLHLRREERAERADERRLFGRL